MVSAVGALVRVVRRPLFLDDLTEAYAHLAGQSPRAADALLDEVELLVELLTKYPEIGRARSECADFDICYFTG